MKFFRSSVCLAAALVLSALFTHSTSAFAQGTFTYLEDGAEAGGYDVTAEIGKLPAELMLAQQENNSGYLVRLTEQSIELAMYQGGKKRNLAQVRTTVGPGALTVQRRGARWNILAGNRTVLQAEDETWLEGKIGYRGGLQKLMVQPVESISFDDDFMRIEQEVAMEKAKDNPKLGVKVSDVKAEETLWAPLSGSWSTTGISENQAAQVAQSANPFAFKSGMAGTNIAVAGRPFWSDYEVGASVKPQGAQAIGLAVYVQDAKNYLVFHWRDDAAPQLRAVLGNGAGGAEVRVLDESAAAPYDAGYEQKQWYRLRFSVAGGFLRAFIDDIEVLRARTGLFGRGQIAVYSENPDATNFATFDDVTVRSVEDVYDDFSVAVPGRWQSKAGAWTLTGSASPKGAQGAYTVTGDVEWRNYTASADLQVPADAAAGLLLYHQPGKGAYVLRVTGSKAKAAPAGTVQIFRIWNGKTQTLAEVKSGSQYDNRTTRWSFSGADGYLKAAVDTNGNMKTVLDAFDEIITAGRPGLYGQRGAQGTPRLAEFAVEFPRTYTTWAKVPDLYELDRQAETMGGWSTPEGLWAPANPLDIVKAASTTTANPAEGTTLPPATATTNTLPGGTSLPGAATMPGGSATPGNRILWHKGAFWGDDAIRFKLPAMGVGQTITLILGDARGSGSQALQLQVEGDRLKTSLSTADLSGSTLKLGTPAKSQQSQLKIEGAIDTQVVELTRRGSYLIVRAGTAEQMKTVLASRVYG